MIPFRSTHFSETYVYGYPEKYLGFYQTCGHYEGAWLKSRNALLWVLRFALTSITKTFHAF